MDVFFLGLAVGGSSFGIAAFFLYRWAYKKGINDVLSRRKDRVIRSLKKSKEHEKKLREMDEDDFWDHATRNMR